MRAVPMSLIAAVIFDMDGVLINSEPLHLQATRLALGTRGAWYTEQDNETFLDATDREVFRILRILFDLEPTTDELVAAKVGHLQSLIRSGSRPLPGVPDVPRKLEEAGILLGLVSSSGRPVIRVVLETLELAGAFHAMVSGDEVPRGKPAPDGFLMAARRLGVEPASCLVVEDSRSGLLAGKEAGMAVAAIPRGAASGEDFSPADFVLPTLEALPKAIGRDGSTAH